MQGNCDSSCARRIGQWQAVLAGIAASVLAVTAAQADPRIDSETASAPPAAAQDGPRTDTDTAPPASAAIATQADPKIDADTAARTEAAPASAPDPPGGEETAAPASAATAPQPGAQPDMAAVAATPAPPDPPSHSCSAANLDQFGVASWYGRHWRGRRTASGRRFDERRLTAASLSLPLATRARVTNLRNGRSVDVLVNDRGPYIGGRIIDLSARAAQLLGMTRNGLAFVAITALPSPVPGRSSI